MASLEELQLEVLRARARTGTLETLLTTARAELRVASDNVRAHCRAEAARRKREEKDAKQKKDVAVVKANIELVRATLDFIEHDVHRSVLAFGMMKVGKDMRQLAVETTTDADRDQILAFIDADSDDLCQQQKGVVVAILRQMVAAFEKKINGCGCRAPKRRKVVPKMDPVVSVDEAAVAPVDLLAVFDGGLETAPAKRTYNLSGCSCGQDGVRQRRHIPPCKRFHARPTPRAKARCDCVCLS